MMSVDEIRTHVLDLKRRRVRLIGHRAMLVRLLDEIDALAGALARKEITSDVLYWAAIAADESAEPSRAKITAQVSAALLGALFELKKALARLETDPEPHGRRAS